ncbi:MAG: hypothetical protein QM783_13345 [Phycisphaerales bacterium]
MPDSTNRRRKTVAIVLSMLVVIVVVLLLLLKGCKPQNGSVGLTKSNAKLPAPPASNAASSAPASGAAPVAERLTAATLTAPEAVSAGAEFAVAWTGPDNAGDFVTIVRADAAASESKSYRQTSEGPSLRLTAPMEPGAYELRYVTGPSRTVLGRARIAVQPVSATVAGPAEVVIGSPLKVRWTGPNNAGDYVTIVAKGAGDEQYGSYEQTAKGAELTLTAPTQEGDAELRYVAAGPGAGGVRTVLARAAIKVVAAAVKVNAPERAVAGSRFEVSWTGPNNAGDYITVVPADAPDAQYASYVDVSKGSPTQLTAPIDAGKAEVRYVTGQGRRVLARTAITIVAATVTLSAPDESEAGKPVSIEWTGPSNAGDYITIVPKGTPDAKYGAYTNTTAGSPLNVKCPAEVGEAEVRYVSGTGGKVLARRAIRVK